MHLFGDNHSVAKNSSQFRRCTSTTITPKNVASERSGCKPYVQCCLTRKWTWLPVISTELLGDAPPVPAPTASLKKPSSVLTCLCLLVPHRCGVQSCARYMVRRVWVYQASQSLTSVGKYGNTVHSPFSTKLWEYGRQIGAAITRYGSTCILWSGAAVKRITKDTNDDSS